MKTWTTADKSGWGEGPWQAEPDKVQWVDGATDLDCLLVRSHLGNWCGYVGLPRSHPFYGADYDEVDVEVHGGLTFAAACDEEAPEGEGICHVPEPGRDGDVWWLGFDCGHAFDFQPAMEARMAGLGLGTPVDLRRSEIYRDLEYARAETIELARQLRS